MPKQLPSDSVLDTHRPFIKNTMPIRLQDIKKGMAIRFEYKGELRHVFVLNPNFHGFLHGLSMKSIKRHELIPIVEAMPKLTEKALYESYLTSSNAKQIDSYRTYRATMVSSPRLLQYEVPKTVL